MTEVPRPGVEGCFAGLCRGVGQTRDRGFSRPRELVMVAEERRAAVLEHRDPPSETEPDVLDSNARTWGAPAG